MDALKNLRSRIGQGVVRTHHGFTRGWRDLFRRSGGALTRFDASAKESVAGQDFPRWGLLAAETWETAQSVIIRMEMPGMRKEDIDVSIDGNLLRVRGEKRSGGEYEERRYRLVERAYGRFERTIPLPLGIDPQQMEVSYQDGVITMILPKTETTPPRQVTNS